MPAPHFSNGLIKRASAARASAIPPATCFACEGSGFIDALDLTTGEVEQELCAATPACKAHAERVERWAARRVLEAFIRSFDEH